MLTCNCSDYQDGSNFDAIKFELKHAEDFEKSQKQYFESNYEIDCQSDWCGSLYRVWDGHILLGTFYQKQKKWIADPYYKNRQYLRLEESMHRSFCSNQLAIDYIIRSYEGC